MSYQFTFGYLALKMLGKTLYSNPFAAISELVANGFDAGANKVYVYLDIRDKKRAVVEILDNGKGMSDADVLNKYLKVGKNNRLDSNTVMGRKGIGKLAAFYLSNTYYISTKNNKENNSYSIDFTQCELNENEENYMERYDGSQIVNNDLFDKFATGTAITIKNVNFTGLGNKRLETFYNDISEYYAFNDDTKKIFVNVVLSESENDFKEVKKSIAFKNMEYIMCSKEYTAYDSLKQLNGTVIKEAEKEDSDTIFKIRFEDLNIKCEDVTILDKKVAMNPYGWVGVHQTIKKDKAHKNDSNFIDSKFYNFNKVRIYVRNKLALENILPDVHNTQYYSNYIEGEIHCDELDLNDLPDIASSNRQSFDKNDARVQALIEYVKKIVNILVNEKRKEIENDKKNSEQRQTNAINALSEQVGESLENLKDGKVTPEDITNVKHTITKSFKDVKGRAKTKYSLFISHKRSDKLMADFVYNYLIRVCKFEKSMIFYSSSPEGRDERYEQFNLQILNSLADENTFVCFFVGKGFMNSEYCMFEGGAAWAVKQSDVIGLFYDKYENVPAYLKPMKNIQTLLNEGKLERDNYIKTINFLNEIISYLNKNYLNAKDQAPLLSDNLPDEVELGRLGKRVEDCFDKQIVSYWNTYIKDHYKEYRYTYIKVQTIDDNIIYANIYEASKEYNCNAEDIKFACENNTVFKNKKWAYVKK